MNTEPSEGSASEPQEQKGEQSNHSKKGISMHENVPVWHDSCSCEAEPYWTEAVEEAERLSRQGRPDEPGEGSGKDV
ncbi:MAG: hypothetical protein AB1344_08190 [Pseudomonadota bacterium]